MTDCQPLPATVTAPPGAGMAVSLQARRESSNRWQLRRAVRVMNEVLARLGLAHYPDKTFIGRVSRGFDFLGVDCQPGAPLAPSAVSLARKTERIARLYEQGASLESIGRYEVHWSRWHRSLTDRSDPAAPAPQGRHPRRPTQRLSDDPSVSSQPIALWAAESSEHKS